MRIPPNSTIRTTALRIESSFLMHATSATTSFLEDLRVDPVGFDEATGGQAAYIPRLAGVDHGHRDPGGGALVVGGGLKDHEGFGAGRLQALQEGFAARMHELRWRPDLVQHIARQGVGPDEVEEAILVAAFRGA